VPSPAHSTEGSQRKAGSAALGLVAVGIAATDLFAIIAALTLSGMGRRWVNLSTAFGWLVFDYGFVIDVMAFVLAGIAICVGGRNRKLGLLALALVGCDFLILFL
jgi:hypothetical protein